jgi:hypothetical protein
MSPGNVERLRAFCERLDRRDIDLALLELSRPSGSPSAAPCGRCAGTPLTLAPAGTDLVFGMAPDAPFHAASLTGAPTPPGRQPG